MTDHVPRKRIEPLAPPAGQFDRVMSEARYRRHRRAMAMLTVAFVFVAGLGGGLALGRDVPERIVQAASDVVGGGPTTSAGAEPSQTATSATRSANPSQASTKGTPERQAPIATKLSDPPRGELSYRGRAVGPAGQPAGGLFVYAGAPGETGFVPSGDYIGVTAEDGTFSMSCPKAPVLLAPWPINAEAKSKARDVDWGATFVGGASQALLASDVPCTRNPDKIHETTVLRGAALEGKVSMPAGCRDAKLGLWVWIGNDRSLHVNVQDLQDGDSYRVSGLPAGEHTIGANGEHYRVRVGATGTVMQDVLFACNPGDGGTTETPAPTSTDTSTVVPTIPTSTATSTASSTSSSTSTGTATADPGATKTP